jgi:hypothetical protein
MFKILKTLLNIKVILGAFIFGVGVFAILVGILWTSKAKNITQVPATAILSLIEVPTETPISPITTHIPTLSPTTSQQLPPPSGDIKIGNYVQVSGTGGDGLRLHNTAEVSSKVNYIAYEAEVFLVIKGPIDADGYIWWELQDPYTDNAVGWGVANYLQVIQNP